MERRRRRDLHPSISPRRKYSLQALPALWKRIKGCWRIVSDTYSLYNKYHITTSFLQLNSTLFQNPYALKWFPLKNGSSDRRTLLLNQNRWSWSYECELWPLDQTIRVNNYHIGTRLKETFDRALQSWRTAQFSRQNLFSLLVNTT